MTIQVKCPECSKEYRLKDELAGKKIRCKECETSFAVPKPKKKKPAEEPEGSISNFDLAALDLAEEERTSRAYKKRQAEDDKKKVKKKDESIDHEHADIMLGNVGKFAGIVLGVHFASFGMLWFLSWMQSEGFIKFFWYVYRISLGLAGLISVGSLIGSIIWYPMVSLKESRTFFGINLVSALLSWFPITLLAAVGLRYLMRMLLGIENIADPQFDYFKPHLVPLGIAAGVGLAFPVYYISTRWYRVSRSIYLGLIGMGVALCVAGTHAIIVLQEIIGAEGQ